MTPRREVFRPLAIFNRNAMSAVLIAGALICLACDVFAQPRRPRRGLPPLPPGPPIVVPLPAGPPTVLPGGPTPFLPTAQPVMPNTQPAATPAFQGDFHLEVSEELLQTLVRRQDVSQGAVQDFVSGAVVNGQQTTQSDVTVDCIPSTQGGQFDFVVQGLVSSTTNAATPQATIQQQGNTAFRATKRVFLTGETILTQKAIVQVMPNQVVTGAQTNPGPLSMFGNLGNRMAYRAAIARLPESNMIAGQKTINRMQPEMDRKIDTQLAEADRAVRDNLWKRLEVWNVLPEYKAAFSTTDRLIWDYRLRTEPVPYPVANSSLQQMQPNAAAANLPDVSVHCHESLFETVAMRRKLGGKTISLNELRDATDRFLRLLAEEIPDNSPQLPVTINFTFDSQDPLTASYDNDLLILTLKGSFQAGNLPATPTQQIQLFMDAQMEQDAFLIEVSEVTVNQLAADNSLEEPGLTQTAIAEQLKKQLKPIRLKRAIPLPVKEGAGPTLVLTSMTAEGGWLEADFELQTWRPAETKQPVHSAPTPVPTFTPQSPISPQPTGPTFPQ